MLYSTFEILAALGAILIAIGIVRLLMDFKGSDAIDVIILLFGGLLAFASGLSAGSLEFVCTGGTQCINGVQTYNGDFFLFYILIAMGLLAWCLSIVATIVLMGTVFKRRRQKF